MKKRQVLRGHIVHSPALGRVNILEGGYIVTEDGKITSIGVERPPMYPGTEFYDYGPRLLMQSFADMHMHAPQYPMLGMGMDLQLLDWLKTYTFKTEARFSDSSYARVVYRKLAQTLIQEGTTRVCAYSSLHREGTLILMEEFERAGLVAYVGKVNMDRHGAENLQEDTEESLRETRAWLEACKDFKNIKPILTPRFIPSCSDALLEGLSQIRKEYKVLVQSHLSENLGEIAWVSRLQPDCAQYWEAYAKYDMFLPKTIMAHCVYSDERELQAIRDNGVVVAHCPDSNINLISGIAPVRRMLDMGIWVTLGSDIAGGSLISMLAVTAMVIRSSKMKRIMSGWQGEFLTVDEAYYLGTSAGARYFGASDGFAVGDPLHAIVIDDLAFVGTESLSIRERYERAIYQARSKEIVAVYSEGKEILHRPGHEAFFYPMI